MKSYEHTYEALEAALALIEDERNWCQGPRGWRGPSYCLEGAIAAALGMDASDAKSQREMLSTLFRSDAYNAVYAEVRPLTPWLFNDSHGHAGVVAVVQRAIAAEKAKAGVHLDVPEADVPEAVPA